MEICIRHTYLHRKNFNGHILSIPFSTVLHNNSDDTALETCFNHSKMKKIFKGLSLAIFALLCAGATQAQTDFQAQARLDSTHILIGDQVKLHLSISGKTLPQTIFPQACDTCLPGLEVVHRSAIDTQQEAGRFTLSQDWTLTGFDSGRFEIPAMPFFGPNAELLAGTQALAIDVQTIAVDTNAAFKDIKPVLQSPLTFKEIVRYIGIGLGILALIGGIVYLAYRYGQKRKKPEEGKRLKPKEPAHIIAFRALENLRQKKLWQDGRHKEYYSELSEILRTYLYHRWDISAMEMVSDEIVDALMQVRVEQRQLNELRITLQTADSVKFAKACPLPDENAQAFQHVYDFVDATKATEKPEEKEGETHHE